MILKVRLLSNESSSLIDDYALDDHMLFDICIHDSVYLKNCYFFCYSIAIGDRVLTEVERRNQIRMQQTYQHLLENERKRMDREYQLKSEEMARKWRAQLDDEKVKLQKVLFCYLLKKPKVDCMLFL